MTIKQLKQKRRQLIKKLRRTVDFESQHRIKMLIDWIEEQMATLPNKRFFDIINL